VYFARTSGSYAKSLGLGNNTLTQGLASKLIMPPAGGATGKDTVFVQGDGWLDIGRSDSLWNLTFKGPPSIIKTGNWIDRPSVGIPYLYVATGIELAEALRGQGRNSEAMKFFNTARQIAHVVNLDDLLRPAEAEFAQPLTGDTAGQALPNSSVPTPAPAKTDTQSKPGAKAKP
jgi:hypothetical protein